jgi:hypothetical protein
VLKGYLLNVAKKDLFEEAPQLRSLLRQWHRTEEVKQSAVSDFRMLLAKIIELDIYFKRY